MTMPARSDGRFFVLEGPDGVGKTTLAARLADCSYDEAVPALARPGTIAPLAPNGARSGAAADARPRPGEVSGAGRRLVFVPRRQVSSTSPYAATLMRHLATMLWESGDAPDLSDAFWVGLQAAWFTAHSETVLAPLLAAGHDVIVDGWIYKFCSKLLLQGYTQPDLDVIFQRVRVPDVVVLLTADPADLYDRGRTFRPAELGMHAGYQELNRTTFIDYQRAGLKHLHTYAARHRWPAVPLDMTATPDQSAARLSDLIAELRCHPPSDRTAAARFAPGSGILSTNGAMPAHPQATTEARR